MFSITGGCRVSKEVEDILYDILCTIDIRELDKNSILKSIISQKGQIITQASTTSLEKIIAEDGILCSILSSLKLREAVGTCVLSSRWRRLWTHLPKLSFGVANMFDDQTLRLLYGDDSTLTTEEKSELMIEKTDHFIRSVNSVLQQLKGRRFRVDEFVVRYFLHKVHSHHLDAWIRFAVSSNTIVLALHLDNPFDLDFEIEKYDFPCHLLESASFIEELILASCSLKPPCKFNGLSHLKRLTLHNVDATEEDITHLLSNCYTLEFLKLDIIPQLEAIRIPHPRSQLRTLVVKECVLLRGAIKIHAINLVNLGYYGYPVDFVFRQSSQLLKVYIKFETEEWEPPLEFYLNKLSSNLPQLELLSCTIIGNSKVPNLQKGSNSLTRVRHLVPDLRKGSNSFIHLRFLDWCWEVSVKKMSILQLVTLLDATPFLEELNLRLWTSCSNEKAPKRLRKLRKRLPEHPHRRLKALQFMDFYWDKWHVEFMLYLLKNAIELERMILLYPRVYDETTTNKLTRVVPAKVKLVVSE